MHNKWDSDLMLNTLATQSFPSFVDHDRIILCSFNMFPLKVCCGL